MWNSLAMAKMVRFQVNMPLRDQLAALALEVKIELALITYFNESIPDPGEKLGRPAPLPGDRHQAEASALGQPETEG